MKIHLIKFAKINLMVFVSFLWRTSIAHAVLDLKEIEAVSAGIEAIYL